ncbi:MAG: aminoacyl-tRNA hydrolase [Chloroflexi bacterium]|nr:aminoacyl-tRNA hydrolase [Chloroflexota bacterium]MBA3851199.1 aminoacyl-tRNA hydrolase [Chloroflexota bacterium]MDQ3407891.1 aminoacyl-tRNA hydrolase [Chloroflexota bacterium]
MKIVVGLGNPGRQYEGTRHNVGWMVLDRIAERAGWSGKAKARDAAAVARGRHGDLDLVLVKPTTYMNLSGLAVRKVLARERAPLADMLVVVDDFALPMGRLRLREEGSAGGHNGLRSIIGEMGTQGFARLRVGIGDPGQRAVDHVLSRFGPSERADLELVLDAAADAVEDWAREGTSRAANRWNPWRLGASDVGGPGHGGPVEATDPTLPAPPTLRIPEREGKPDKNGIVRTLTGWRKLLPPGRRDRP